MKEFNNKQPWSETATINQSDGAPLWMEESNDGKGPWSEIEGGRECHCGRKRRGIASAFQSPQVNFMRMERWIDRLWSRIDRVARQSHGLRMGKLMGKFDPNSTAGCWPIQKPVRFIPARSIHQSGSIKLVIKSTCQHFRSGSYESPTMVLCRRPCRLIVDIAYDHHVALVGWFR